MHPAANSSWVFTGVTVSYSGEDHASRNDYYCLDWLANPPSRKASISMNV